MYCHGGPTRPKPRVLWHLSSIWFCKEQFLCKCTIVQWCNFIFLHLAYLYFRLLYYLQNLSAINFKFGLGGNNTKLVHSCTMEAYFTGSVLLKIFNCTYPAIEFRSLFYFIHPNTGCKFLQTQQYYFTIECISWKIMYLNISYTQCSWLRKVSFCNLWNILILDPNF